MCINEEFTLGVEEPEINKQDTSLVLFCFLATAIKAALRLSHKRALQIEGFIFPLLHGLTLEQQQESTARLALQPQGNTRAATGLSPQPPAEQALTHAVCNQHHFN